jgi:hypothetical protein
MPEISQSVTLPLLLSLSLSLSASRVRKCSKSPTKFSQGDNYGSLLVISKDLMHPNGYVRSGFLIALLRLRTLSTSYAEGFLVISWWKVEYDKTS